jgi:hypothetical protein
MINPANIVDGFTVYTIFLHAVDEFFLNEDPGGLYSIRVFYECTVQ